MIPTSNISTVLTAGQTQTRDWRDRHRSDWDSWDIAKTKKNETIVGEIYMSQSQNYDFFCFCSGFRVSKVLSFSLLQFIGMPNLCNLSKSEWPNLPHIYAMRLGTGGARRPPGPPFDKLAQICWYYWIESQVPRFIICKSFSEFSRDGKVFWKKRLENIKKFGQKIIYHLWLTFYNSLERALRA